MKLLKQIDAFFNWMADILIWVIFIALIIGSMYLTHRYYVYAAKQAIEETRIDTNP